MKQFLNKILFILLIHCCIPLVFSQNTPENLKTALVFRIANCVKWNADTSSTFKIGILSNNQLLIDKFNELAKVARINKKRIQIIRFTNENSIKPTHLLYIDQSYNPYFSAVIKKIYKQNSLLISEEHDQSGEIMINLRLDDKSSNYTFEYNRANILFAGLDLTDEIVLLKGTEIEIRKLYLQAKKLWDEQQAIVLELKKQTDLQNKNLSAQKDSISRMKKLIDDNQLKISKQLIVLSQKDSVSNQLNSKIFEQQAELSLNFLQTRNLIDERNKGEEIIRNQESKINQQLKLSNSLSKDINEKQKALIEQNKALSQKESVIQKQSNWLLVSAIFILIVFVFIFFISRAYVVIRKAKFKIAEQKEELETTIEQLKNMQQQLIQSEKMASLGVFVAGVAHEINNPINFISTGIQSIEKVMGKVISLCNQMNCLTPESKSEDIQNLIDLKQNIKFQRSMDAMPEIMANINMGIKRTVDITNGLRLYARMDKEEKCLYDINQIMDTALLLIKQRLNSRIDLMLNYGTFGPIMVFPGKLSQVFVNILGNAIDSIHEIQNQNEKAVISIITKEIENKIVIEISDTGKGIPDETLQKLFDPFFTTKQVGKGTGLGMSISLSIIEAHNGTITAKNNSGKGATFRIEIPV